MNFYTIILYGYIMVAALLLYFINRDRQKPKLFCGRHRLFSLTAMSLLTLGILAAVDARFIEIHRLKTTAVTIRTNKLPFSARLAFLTDMHVGEHKKTAAVEKMVQKIQAINPDLVLIGGDFITNYGSAEDESAYLEPLRKLTAHYPVFATFGNHEYGIGQPLGGGAREHRINRTAEVAARLQTLGITLLRNELACPEIRQKKICLYGTDELWSGNLTFDPLKKFDFQSPLVVFAHNPDIVMSYPAELPKPDIVLAGHTHNGQINLPLLGPLGNADIQLGRGYYHGLKTWQEIPLFVTAGAGESGGPIRFFNNPPEITVITLTP